MSGFLQRAQIKLATWMQGRNGIDELSMVLVVAGMALTLIASLFGFGALSFISLLVLAYALFRSYSKNIPQRARELAAYQRVAERPKAWLSLARKRFANRKTKRYFKCEQCHTVFSVPRGKGKVRTICPKCHTESIHRS